MTVFKIKLLALRNGLFYFYGIWQENIIINTSYFVSIADQISVEVLQYL